MLFRGSASHGVGGAALPWLLLALLQPYLTLDDRTEICELKGFG